MDEFETNEIRETMSEVYDRLTAEAEEQEAEREAEREYLASLSEEELAKDTRRQLEAIWDKHYGGEAGAHEGGSEHAALGLDAAPSHWSEEQRESFQALPPAAQAMVLHHVGDLERGMLEQYGSENSGSQPTRWADYLQEHGTTQEAAFDGLMTLDYTLRYGTPDQKRTMLWQLARDFGVDVLGPSITHSNPAISVLQEQIRVLHETNHRLSEQRRLRQQRTNEQIIDSFRDEAIEGRKAHPHFDAIQEDMGRLLQAGRARNLKEAYNIAVSMRPELRAKR